MDEAASETTDATPDSSEVTEIATTYRKRAYRVVTTLVLGILGGYLLALVVANFGAALAFLLGATIAVYAPLLRVDYRMQLTTDRSPEAVRGAFSGPDCPLVALERGWASEFEPTEDGGEFSYTGFKIFRRDVRYEADATEGGVTVSVYRNDGLLATYEVDVESTDEGTRVSIDGHRESRMHLRAALIARLGESERRRVYEALGYTVESHDLEVGL